MFVTASIATSVSPLWTGSRTSGEFAEVAELMADAGLVVLASFISPFRAERQLARELAGEDRFCEVFVDTSIEVAEARDRKGLVP
jgi:adenylylsulfate kinase-like enzyme